MLLGLTIRKLARDWSFRAVPFHKTAFKIYNLGEEFPSLLQRVLSHIILPSLLLVAGDPRRSEIIHTWDVPKHTLSSGVHYQVQRTLPIAVGKLQRNSSYIDPCVVIVTQVSVTDTDWKRATWCKQLMRGKSRAADHRGCTEGSDSKLVCWSLLSGQGFGSEEEFIFLSVEPQLGAAKSTRFWWRLKQRIGSDLVDIHKNHV